MEKVGIDPTTSRMLSVRSTIWATSPLAPTRIWTGVTGFKVQCDDHYTIGATKIHFYLIFFFLHEVGFEPTRS